MEFFREYYWLSCGLATLLLGLSIILTGRWHGPFTTDHMHGVQKFHVSPTPRIGGVAILGGTWVGYLLSPELSKIVFLPILLASLPTFMFGLADDLTKRITPAWRMVATMVSALLAWYLTDVALSLQGVPLLMPLFATLWVAVPFTVFAVSGVVNAVNIIDGFNGLAGSTLVYLLLGTGYLAAQMGDPALADVAMLLAAAVVGFLVLNWPFGKIFLGDGGAYFCGFVLAWLCIFADGAQPRCGPVFDSVAVPVPDYRGAVQHLPSARARAPREQGRPPAFAQPGQAALRSQVECHAAPADLHAQLGDRRAGRAAQPSGRAGRHSACW